MSRAPKPYVPEPGTIPARVVAHFRERPDLYEMSSAELARAFDIPLKNVSGSLAYPVRFGLLALRRAGRQCWYRAGPALNGVCASAPECPPAGARPVQPAAVVRTPTAHGLTAALYNDGELYLHGAAPLEDGAVLLSAAQAAELRAYLLHTGSVSVIASANGGSLT